MAQDAPSSSNHCLNCNAVLSGNFCASCGQKAGIRRITFNETIKDFFSSAFALEGPLMRTIRLLIVNPGQVFRDMISGKRKNYYKPVAFFVLITALYIILRTIINYDPLEGSREADPNAPQRVRRSWEAARYMVSNINNIMIVLAISIGLNQKLFFWKKYNLAELTMTGFYITGMYTFFALFFMPANQYLFPAAPKQIQLIVLCGYLLYCLVSFHQRRSFWAFIKYILVSFFSVLGYVILGFALSFLMVSLR